MSSIPYKVWNSLCIPDDWRRAVLISIFKAGDKTLVGNYRGICFQAIAAKVYALKRKLQNWAESTHSEMVSDHDIVVQMPYLCPPYDASWAASCERVRVCSLFH